jgi:hypothetical protein
VCASFIIGVIDLMMEAARTSETSVDIELRTRQCIPEDSELHTRRHENLKSHKMTSVCSCSQVHLFIITVRYAFCIRLYFLSFLFFLSLFLYDFFLFLLHVSFPIS